MSFSIWFCVSTGQATFDSFIVTEVWWLLRELRLLSLIIPSVNRVPWFFRRILSLDKLVCVAVGWGFEGQPNLSSLLNH